PQSYPFLEFLVATRSIRSFLPMLRKLLLMKLTYQLDCEHMKILAGIPSVYPFLHYLSTTSTPDNILVTMREVIPSRTPLLGHSSSDMHVSSSLSPHELLTTPFKLNYVAMIDHLHILPLLFSSLRFATLYDALPSA